MARVVRLVSTALLVCGLACTNSSGTALGTSNGAQDGGGVAMPGWADAGRADEPTPPGPGPLPDQAAQPGVAPLRRLTLLEYDNTLRDLLGLTGPPPSTRLPFAPDVGAGQSGFTRGASVTTGDDFRTFFLSAEQAAAAVLARLPALLPCSPVPAAQTEQDACAERFITQFGRRAYRRPLLPREVDRLRTLYQAARAPDAAATFEEAIGDLIAAMLQAPEFLYRWELGPHLPIKDGAFLRFNGYELASRLSYLFWASMPDEELLAAADAGQLSSTEQLVRQARRLLADGRARSAVEDFHAQWLEVTRLEEVPKDATLGQYTPALARSMLDESRAFAASLFFGPNATGKLEALLTSNASFVDAALARLYGVDAPAGAGLQPVALPPTQRAGILTRGAFLAYNADASESNPVDRGAVITRRLLCMDLSEPVDLVVPVVADPMPGSTTRERFEAHGRLACAAACHDAFIDQIGYAFEHYDAIGAYRATDQGKPVNARGSFQLPSMGELRYDGAVQLMPLLARSEEVQRCLPVQWLRYLLRRQEHPDEKPTVTALGDAFRDSGHDLRALLLDLPRTRAFTHRRPSTGEKTQ